VDAWSLPTGGPAWLAYDFCLPDAADGTGWTPPDGIYVPKKDKPDVI